MRAFIADYSSCCRAQRYGVLFFLLVVVSHVLSVDGPSVTGNVQAERLTAAVTEDEMRDLTRRWLAGWGLVVGGSSAGIARQAGVVEARPASESNASAFSLARNFPTADGEAALVAVSKEGS